MYISTRMRAGEMDKAFAQSPKIAATPKPRTDSPSTTCKTLVRAVKLTGIFLLIGFLQVSAGTSAQQRISISLKSATLEKAFAEIEKRSGYTIFYNVEVLRAAGLVTLEMKDVTVEDVLHQCLKGLPLEFTVQDKTIFVKKESRKVVSAPANSEGDPPAISGVVRAENGTPLDGATVFIKGLNKSSQTSPTGDFMLKNVPNGVYEVEISFIGYETFKTTVTVAGNQATVVAKMKAAQNSLDELVVKGYYNTSQRLNTGNVTTVKGEDIEKQPVTDPILALEGRVPGLYVQQSNGAPGAYSKIQIRGQNSISNGNDPLYIVDGVPFSSVSLTSRFFGGGVLGSTASANSNSNGQGMSPFNALNPSDIETISVLKDADATAIYGSRGANGVILITTKKGKFGDTQFNLNAYTGAGKIAREMTLLNTPQYLAMKREAFQNDGLPVPSIATDPYDYNYDIDGVWDTTRYTNWQKVLIGNPANFTNLQGTLSGGSANTRFVIGGGYSNQGTVFIGNYWDQKASGHFNLTHTSTNQRLHLSIDVLYVNDNSKLPGSDFTSSITQAPDAPALYDATGNINWAFYDGSITFLNPIAETAIKSTAITDNFISSLNIGYEIFSGLQIKSNFGYSRDQMKQSFISPASATYPPYNTLASSRYVDFGTNESDNWIIEPQINYKKSFGRSHVEALVGSTFQQRTQNSLAYSASGFSSDALLGDPLASQYQNLSGVSSVLYRYNALYGRVQYDWQEKYLINVTARRDGSSRFGPGKQFGNFGALGVGWIFSKEKFAVDNLSFISFGKLRASYGVTGNDQITDYQFLSTYTPISTTYETVNGLTPTQLTNPYFAWEVVKKIEGGLELGFLKQRIYFSASFYRNRTGNQLVGLPLPYVAGFKSVQYNLPAVVQNTGIELVLTTTNISNKNFTWTTTANLTVPENKLVAFPNLANFASYKNTYVVGQSLFIKKLYHYTGVDPQSGIYTFATKNSNGVPSNPQDLVTTRPVTQKFYGGIGNSFTYKRLQLNVFFQYVNQLGYSYKDYFDAPGSGGNEPTLVLKHWMSAGDIATVQKFGTASTTTNPYTTFRSSDGIITGASFLRLKSLSLSYQLPAVLQKKAHAQNASIYVQCQNLLTFAKYAGLDPETGGLNLPPLRMITAGFKISL